MAVVTVGQREKGEVESVRGWEVIGKETWEAGEEEEGSAWEEEGATGAEVVVREPLECRGIGGKREDHLNWLNKLARGTEGAEGEEGRVSRGLEGRWERGVVSGREERGRCGGHEWLGDGTCGRGDERRNSGVERNRVGPVVLG